MNQPQVPQLQAVQCQIERLGEVQPKLRANDWRSPLIYRLLKDTIYQDGSAGVNLTVQPSEVEMWLLQLSWQGLEQDFGLCLNSYQEPVLTEYAALAVSCIVVRHVLKTAIIRVTRRGEKADFWLEDRENLLEVSGQVDGDLDILRNNKKQQLLDNPMGKPGYVSVTNFTRCHSYLCYYEQPGGKV